MTVFQQMISDLEAKGWTVHKIATELTRRGFRYRWNQIDRVKDGGRVVYPLDYLLAKLHTEEFGDVLTIVPRASAIEMRMA